MSYNNYIAGDVSVFVDNENLFVSNMETLGEPPIYGALKEYVVTLGRIFEFRTYIKYRDGLEDLLYILKLQAIQPIFIPKTDSDAQMGFDISTTLTESPNVTKFVLVTGDGDFTEIVHRIRAKGKKVIIVAISNALSDSLVNAADNSIFYEDLHKKFQQNRINKPILVSEYGKIV